MKHIIDNYLQINILLAFVFASCVSCEKDTLNDDTSNNNITDNFRICIEWGLFQEQVIEYMKGYSLDKAVENYLYFSKNNTSQIISYEFYEGKLCSSVLMTFENKNLESKMLDIVSEYTKVGSIDDAEIYFNEDINTIASYSIEIDDDNTYSTLGFTQLDLTPPVFKIGDYYDRDGKEGVVFQVDTDGLHGKIVSLTETKCEWTSNYQEKFRLIGATNRDNGVANLAVVTQIPEWHSKFPAFAWCTDLGEGWYLPAINELLTLFTVSNIDIINETLTKMGGVKISNPDETPDYYLSSTEYRLINFEYQGILMVCINSNGIWEIYEVKNGQHLTRAITTF